MYIYVYYYLHMPVTMSVKYWLCDFEAYQFGATYFPVEISLLNLNNEKCATFYIGWKHLSFTVSSSKTFTHQYNRHGLCWDAGRLTLTKAIKAIQKRVKASDIVFVKGEQKAKWLMQWLKAGQIIDLGGIDVFSFNNNNSADHQNERKCEFHAMNPNYKFCARQKCFMLLPCAKTHCVI